MENNVVKAFVKLGYFILMIYGVHLLGEGTRDQWHWYYSLFFLSIIMINFFIHVFIHELGHLLGGFVSGYTFFSFRILSVVWIKEHGKIKMCRQRVSGLMGQCLMIPPENTASSPFMLYHLGGILANFMIVILAFFTLFISFPIIVIEGIVLFIIIGIFSVTVNIFPFGTTDGKNIWEFSRSSMKRIQGAQILRIHAGMMQGETFENLQQFIYFNKELPLTDTYNVVMQSLKVSKHIEAFEYELAIKCLLPLWKNFDQIQDGYKAIILREYLFLLLLSFPTDEDITIIAKSKLFENYINTNQANSKRIMAAYAFIKEKNGKKAKQLIQEARNYVGKMQTLTDRKLEMQLIDHLEELIIRDNFL